MRNCVIALFLLAWTALSSAENLLTINQARVFLAPPNAKVLAAYMTLKNTQTQDLAIIGVSADCCASAMFHRSRREQDMAIMEQLGRLELASGAEQQLKPGAMHLMLMQPKKNLVLGDKVVIRFRFSNGSSQDVVASVTNADK